MTTIQPPFPDSDAAAGAIAKVSNVVDLIIIGERIAKSNWPLPIRQRLRALYTERKAVLMEQVKLAARAMSKSDQSPQPKQERKEQ